MRFPLSSRLLWGILPLVAGVGMSGAANLEDLQPRAMAILEASCAECHDGTGRKRDKGDFDHVLDVPRMIEGEYFLVPGDPLFSEIYAVMIEEDPEIRMPPPDNTEVHQPSEKEIQLIHDWIIALGDAEAAEEDREEEEATLVGDARDNPQSKPEADGPNQAETEEAAAKNADLPAPAPDRTASMEESSGIEPTTLLGRIHPLLVHFPVALLPMAGFIALTGLILKRYEGWLPAIRWSLWLAAILAPVSVASGWIQADLEGYRDASVFFHRWSAVALTGIVWLSLVFVEIAERKATRRWRLSAVAFLVLVALLATLVGHSGGELVYGDGYLFGD